MAAKPPITMGGRRYTWNPATGSYAPAAQATAAAFTPKPKAAQNWWKVGYNAVDNFFSPVEAAKTAKKVLRGKPAPEDTPLGRALGSLPGPRQAPLNAPPRGPDHNPVSTVATALATTKPRTPVRAKPRATAPASPVPAAPAAVPSVPLASTPSRTTPVVRQPTVNPAAGAAPLSDYDWAQALADKLLGDAGTNFTDTINKTSAERQTALNGMTELLGKLFGGYNTSGYDQAVTAGANVNEALADRLAGRGAAASTDLASRLTGVDQATIDRVTGDTSQFGTGAANAGAAIGTAGLNALIGDRAAANDYKAKLPGMAGLFGLQATKDLQASTAQRIAEALAGLAAKRPDFVTGLAGQRQSNRNQTRQLDFEEQQFGVKQKTDAAAAEAAAAKDDRNYQLQVRRLGISEAKLQAQLLKDLKEEREKGALRGLTAEKYQEKATTALGLARAAHTPYTDENGEVHPPVSWQQYLNGALAKGVPMWVAIEQGKRVYSQAEIRQGLIPGTGK